MNKYIIEQQFVGHEVQIVLNVKTQVPTPHGNLFAPLIVEGLLIEIDDEGLLVDCGDTVYEYVPRAKFARITRLPIRETGDIAEAMEDPAKPSKKDMS